MYNIGITIIYKMLTVSYRCNSYGIDMVCTEF